MPSNTELFNQAAPLVLAGRIREAAEILSQVESSTLSRRETLEYAKLQRRTGLPDQSLRLLSIYVRPKDGTPHVATDAERAEYALSLQRVGSLREAREVLKGVDAIKAPEALLYESIFHFSEWNYREAIPVLRRLIAMIPAVDYLSRVAQVNLAAALTMEGELAEAEPLLERLRHETAAAGEFMLLGNACEISAQLFLQKRDFAKARAHLQSAEEQLKGVKVLDYLWIVKWRGIMEALEAGSFAPLEEVREEALRKRHWETLREVDYYKLQIHFDHQLYLKLYFGTQSPHYRRRLEKTFAGRALPREVSVGPSWNASEENSGLSLFTGLDADLAPGTVAHAVLVFFLSDWYREFRPGELHAALFKGDYFNPDTSLNRVHQLVLRVRRAIEDRLPGAEIQTVDSSYVLRLSGDGVKLRVPQTLPPPEPLRIRLFMLTSALTQNAFGVEDVKSILGLTKSSANKLLGQWRDEGLIQATTEGKSPEYRAV